MIRVPMRVQLSRWQHSTITYVGQHLWPIILGVTAVLSVALAGSFVGGLLLIMSVHRSEVPSIPQPGAIPTQGLVQQPEVHPTAVELQAPPQDGAEAIPNGSWFLVSSDVYDRTDFSTCKLSTRWQSEVATAPGIEVITYKDCRLVDGSGVLTFKGASIFDLTYGVDAQTDPASLKPCLDAAWPSIPVEVGPGTMVRCDSDGDGVADTDVYLGFSEHWSPIEVFQPR